MHTCSYALSEAWYLYVNVYMSSNYALMPPESFILLRILFYCPTSLEGDMDFRILTYTIVQNRYWLILVIFMAITPNLCYEQYRHIISKKFFNVIFHHLFFFPTSLLTLTTFRYSKYTLSSK